MKSFRRIRYIFLGVMITFLLFIVWYKYQYSMDVFKPFEVNSPNMEMKLLIATQGSDFKDKITNAVVDYYKSDSIFIKVIDIGGLPEIDPDLFSAILVLHTWENWKPPASVKSFIERTGSNTDKIVVLTTSGEGSYKMEEVDALTGESIMEDTPVFTERIIEKLNPLVKENN